MSENNDSSYVFTFCGDDPEHKNEAIRIYGTFESSRNKMFSLYGDKWAFQYPYEDWLELVKTCKTSGRPIEDIIKTI